MKENGWHAIQELLPKDDQRVLAFVPGNRVYLPGKELENELREVIVLRFCENFFAGQPEKEKKHGLHFWSGEGNSNHFFEDVTHWRPIPPGPELD